MLAVGLEKLPEVQGSLRINRGKLRLFRGQVDARSARPQIERDGAVAWKPQIPEEIRCVRGTRETKD
jgi:hypothetical protein